MLLRDGDRCFSHDAVIRVYDDAGNVIETHERTALGIVHDLRRRFARFKLGAHFL